MIKLNHTRTLPCSYLTIISRFATQISPRPSVFPGADRLPGSAFSLQPLAFSLSPTFLLAGLLAMATQTAGLAATNTPAAIPWNEIGAKAGADYQGDGLAVTPTESGARLHCVFQRLDGEATPEGLWLTSTVTNTVSDRFRVAATVVGTRSTACPK